MATDVVAVDVNPTIWAAYCEICDLYVGESNSDPAGPLHAAEMHDKDKHLNIS